MPPTPINEGGEGGEQFGFWGFPAKSTFFPTTKLPGGSIHVRTTRGIIFRQGSEQI